MCKWNVTAGFKCCSCIYKEGQDVKSLYIWVCCLVSPTVGSSQALPSHTWFRLGHFQPPLYITYTVRHTHTYTFTHFSSSSPSESLLCLCVSLSFFALFFSSPVQCSVRVPLVYARPLPLTHTAKACLSTPTLTGWGHACQKVVQSLWKIKFWIHCITVCCILNHISYLIKLYI